MSSLRTDGAIKNKTPTPTKLGLYVYIQSVYIYKYVCTHYNTNWYPAYRVFQSLSRAPSEQMDLTTTKTPTLRKLGRYN